MLGHSALAEAPIGAADNAIRITLTGTADLWALLKPGTATLRASASLAVSADNRILAASDDYISRASDRIANRLFAGTLRQALRFNRSIMGGAGFEGFSLGLGEAILTNAGGEYDGLVGSHAFDGRHVVIRLGDADSAHDTFGVVFSGQSTCYHVNGEEFVLELRDNAYLLDVPASAETFAGTGGIEGGEDLKGRRKPRPFGVCENVPAVALTPNTSLLFAVGSGRVQAIPAVYVRGSKIVPAQDHATPDALAAATIANGTYHTCLAKAVFRLKEIPVSDLGQVTADVDGELLDGAHAQTTADIVALLARGASGVVIDAASFARTRAMQPAPISYYLQTGDEATIAQVIATLMRGIGGWGGFRRNGQFEIGIVQAPKGDPAATRVSDIEIISINREPLPDAIDPPPYRMRAAWGRNWTVQTDSLAGSVSADRLAWLKESFRVSEPVEDATIRVNHPLAQDPAVLPTFFRYEADARKEARRQLVLWRGITSLYRIQLRIAPFSVDLGKELHVTYPRWDLASGKSFALSEVDEDTENTIVEVLAYG